MGVTLDLRLIDHERIAVKGLEVVNDALRHNDPERLREYLTRFPIEVEPAKVAYHQARLSKLCEVGAPEIIIQNEEHFLCLANGEAYRPDAFKKANLDDLRHLLGTWCWVSQSFSLDKLWEELHWFLEPMAGPEDCPLHPWQTKVGDPGQTVFGKALQGAFPYPTDDRGDPVIRSTGSPEASGYNPPNTCKIIYEALRLIEPAVWEKHVPWRCELYRRANLYLDDAEIADRVAEELELARDVFPVLLSAYSKAVAKGYGVSCEYTL